MINIAICKDKRVNQLSNDTSRLAFTWLIAHADCEGRTYGDPAVVRSLVFPRREDVTISEMEGYIREWSNLGLVVWYEVDDDFYIWFPAFEKNQIGLRKDREASSRIPEPPQQVTELLRSNSGITPEQLPVNGMEVKGMECNAPSGAPAPKKKTKPKDERLNHPALIAYNTETHLHIPVNWRDEVIASVTQADRWQRLIHEWMGRGWNKQNIRGMLEAYNNGGITGKAEKASLEGYSYVGK